MKDLKFLLITNIFNELGISLCNQLNNIGFAKIFETHKKTKIINVIVNSGIDVVFLDVDYLGSEEAFRIYRLIENITGKACFYVGDIDVEFKKMNSSLLTKYGYIEYSISKIDLLSLIIDSLNLFNNNKLIRKEKCYDFIYFVWEDLKIKKVQIKSIKVILKKEKSIFLFCNEKYAEKRVINVSFEMLYKLLNKNFEKTRFKIINKELLKTNNQNNVFFSRNSA